MIRSKTLFEFRLFVCAAAMIFVPSPALAQDEAVVRAIPDPATIAAPDVTPTGHREDFEDGNEYFYFHKAGASFEQAYADLVDCYRYLPAGELLTIPGFVPWVEASRREDIVRTGQFGLIGAVFAELVTGPLTRSVQNAKLRRCLEPRAYVRYAIPVATWKSIYRAPPEQAIAVLAKLASGPQPNDRPAPQ